MQFETDMEKLTKNEMATVILKALYNVEHLGEKVLLQRQLAKLVRSKKIDLYPDYLKAAKILGDKHRVKKYIALDAKGAHIITVLRATATGAKEEIIKQLSQNNSRKWHKDKWRAAGCPLLTERGVTLYWAHSLGKWVTIPEDER